MCKIFVYVCASAFVYVCVLQWICINTLENYITIYRFVRGLCVCMCVLCLRVFILCVYV